MKILIIILVIANAFNAFARNRVITGIVTDAETKEKIIFGRVSLLGTKLGTFTDKNGNFMLEYPNSNSSALLQISMIGYKKDTIKISDSINFYNIYLEHHDISQGEITVHGTTRSAMVLETSEAISVVSSETIDKSSENNIIDALVKDVPGMNAVKTGPNISKPYIRGLGYNRVLTLYDDIRQEGQQWGDEHGIEIDPYSIESAEVIKGPASLMYGSDAIAGVIRLNPAKSVSIEGGLKIKYFSEYQSNNGLIGDGLRLSYSNNNWIGILRSSYRIAKNYENQVDGYVYNSNFREINISGMLGYMMSHGYSNINFSIYDNLQGIPDGSRDSLTRQFTMQVNETPSDNIQNRPIVPENELNSYNLSPLHQHIQHYRVYTNNYYQLGKDDIEFMLAFQQNIRREYNHPTDPEQAGMYVQLNTINYNLNYKTNQLLNLETTFGVNGMEQSNKNKDATDFPIPDYNLFDVGAFGFTKWKNEFLTLSAGLRYDVRYLKSSDFYIKNDTLTGFDRQVYSPDTSGATLQFPAINHSFNGLSLSFGAVWKLNDELSIKANFGKGYRAPNITEFASNGLDPGAHIVYIGNRNFVPETNLQEDLGFMGDYKEISFSVSLFNNNIEHYIYLSQLVDSKGNPVVLVPGNWTFQYQQSSAHLYGAEAVIDYYPNYIKGFSLNENFSLNYGYNTNPKYAGKGVDGEYLPLIPPAKILTTIAQKFKTNMDLLTNLYLKAEIEYNAQQNRYLALYNTESYTPSYTLLNLGISADLKLSQKTIIQLQLQGNNIFNLAYQSNLSRLKYFEYYTQSPDGHLGIYNMGRNICLKMIVGFN